MHLDSPQQPENCPRSLLIDLFLAITFASELAPQKVNLLLPQKSRNWTVLCVVTEASKSQSLSIVISRKDRHSMNKRSSTAFVKDCFGGPLTPFDGNEENNELALARLLYQTKCHFFLRLC